MTTTSNRPRITGDTRDQAKKKAANLYAQGLPVRDIAHQMGRSFGLVRTLLLEAGVTLRPRGGRRKVTK